MNSEKNGRSDRPGTSDKVGNAERETPEAKAESENLESTEEIGSEKDLIESETQDRREKPGGKPERVSTKEASVP